MPRVGFEPTIPASKRATTVHAFDNSATMTGEVNNGGAVTSFPYMYRRILLN
jgi:hypothetical protein